LGKPALKNWKPREIIAFLLKNGFEEIKKKTKSKGDHVCLFNKKTKKYTEVDLGRKSYSAREMLTISKQTGISRDKWIK
jgi:predicted RNA binding protein YcfA (HicA-like mRNA interferase family)